MRPKHLTASAPSPALAAVPPSPALCGAHGAGDGVGRSAPRRPRVPGPRAASRAQRGGGGRGTFKLEPPCPFAWY